MSLMGKGITAMKWSSFATIFAIAVQMAQLVIVSRLLSPIDYGLMGMIMVVVAAAVNLTDMGISNAIIHRQDVTREHLSSLYILNLVTSAFICAVIWLSAPFVADFYNEPRLVELIKWMSLLCLIPALGQQFEVLFRKELKFDDISKIQILSYVVGFLIAFLGAYWGYGVYALIGSYLGNALVKSVCLAILGWRRWTPTLHFAKADLKGYLSFGMYQMSANLIQSLMSNVDYIIIGRLFGAQTLGFYTFAYQLCIMPVQKLTPLISTVSLPIFAKMQDQIELLRNGYLKVTEGVSYLSSPIYLGLLVTAPVLVPFVFGSQWVPSIQLIQILSVMMLIRSLMLLQPLLQAKGRADLYFRFTLLSVGIQVPGLILGAYLGGVIGICVAFVCVQLILFAVQYGFAIRKLLGPCLPAYLRSLAPGVFYGLIMVVGVLLIDQLYMLLFSEEADFILQVLCGIVLYVAAIYCFNRNLIQNMRDMLFRKNSLAK